MSATPLYVESDIKSGQTLAGSSFDNTYLFVASGGEILNDQLHGGARGYIEQGGTAVDIGVYSAAFISGGGNTLLSHDTIHAGGVQYLQNDEYPEQATANALDTVILDGGVENIESVGLSISATVSAGGLQQAGENGTASATTVKRDGELQVFAGTATNATIQRGGELEINDFGAAAGLVMAGATAVVEPYNFETPNLSGLTVASGGALVLLGNATETGATIAAGGTLERAAIGIFQTDGADALLISAGNTLAPTLGFGISAFVYSGGVLSDPIVSAGGDAILVGGGTATNAVIQSGGMLRLSGFSSSVTQTARATDPQIFSGGTLVIAGNSTVSGAVIHAGGTAEATSVDEFAVPSTFVDTTVLGGGLLLMGDEADVASRTTLRSGAEMQVGGNAVTDQTTVSSGAVFLALSGTINDTLVTNGGQLTIEPHYGYGGPSGDTFSGGAIEAGGTMTFFSNDGSIVFNDFTLATGATLVELGGATATGLTVAQGATVIDAAIGLFAGVPVGSTYPRALPAQLLSAGDTLTGVTVGAYDYLADTSGGIASGLTIRFHGTADINDGATLHGARVAGNLTIDGGGTAQKVLVESGGYVFNYYGSLVSTTIASGGVAAIERGSAVQTVVSGGGVQYVDFGTVLDTTVLSGGLQDLDAGGAFAAATMIAAGGTAIVSHGTLTNVTLAPGGTIDLAYAQFTTGATASINSADLLTITEGGFFHDTYTLQMAGTYTNETFHVTVDAKDGSLITLAAAAPADAPLAAELVPGGGYAVLSAATAPLPPGGAATASAPTAEAFTHLLPHIV